MTQIADIHCHILPYVDDGALRTTESDELVQMEYDQGVSVICLTPHLRKNMFETPDEEIRRRYEQLLERQRVSSSPIRFYLSREYHCDPGLLKKLEKGEILPLGEGRTILAEFSFRHPESMIRDYVKTILSYGFTPLVAHVERYPALDSPAKVESLIELGALIQMNASAVIGSEGRRTAAWCKKLLKEDLVHVIASDAHDPSDRPPELIQCAEHLERKFGRDRAEKLLWTNPIHILKPANGGTEHAQA